METNHGKTIFAPRLLHKYPHMSPQDIPVWQRFLALHSHRFYGFQYDLCLGNGRPVPAHYDAAMTRCAKFLSQKRVDAIALSYSETWVIEVKPIATLSAVGQAAGYAALYRSEYPHKPKISPILVYSTSQPDLQVPAESLSVTLLPV